MMKRIRLLFAILLMLVSNVSLLAQNTESGLRGMLESRDQEIKELVGPEGTTYTQEQRDNLKDMINGIVDFHAMAAFALGDTYESITDEQRTEFVDLFSTIIRDGSLNNLDIYRANISYDSITIEENKAKVETTAELKNVKTPVHYDMEYKNDEWVITDLIIDDVSTSKSYQRSFRRTLRRNGFEALLNNLRKRASGE